MVHPGIVLCNEGPKISYFFKFFIIILSLFLLAGKQLFGQTEAVLPGQIDKFEINQHIYYL